MNKTEIIAAIAERTRIDKKTAADVFNAGLDIVTETLVGGDAVRLTGLFTLDVKHLDAREGKNPRTGETIPISERTKVIFRAGKELKKAVNAK